MFSIRNVRTLWRTLDRRLARDVLALAVASGFVGLSFGAITVASGLPFWVVPAMSVFVFAGGAQFLAVSLMAGGNPVAAILGGLLLNARHVPFGMNVAGVFGRSWPARLVGSHVMTDESTAFALAQADPARRRAAYWLTGLSLFLCWNVGALTGAVVGNAVGDPNTYGLDAAFPAGLLALILPSLRQREPRRVAAIGAGVAVATTPFLPAGLPVLLALTGLVAAIRRRRPARPAGTVPPPPAEPELPPDSTPGESAMTGQGLATC